MFTVHGTTMLRDGVWIGDFYGDDNYEYFEVDYMGIMKQVDQYEGLTPNSLWKTNFWGDVNVQNVQFTTGNSTGNITVDKAGNLQLLGTATQWEDLVMPILTSKVAGTKAPSLTQFRNGTYAMAFSNAVAGSEEEVFTTLQMSHSYKLNSTINCHIHYTCGTASANNITWALEVSKANINGLYPSSTTLKKVGSCTTAYTHYLADFGSIGNFSGISGVAVARIYRNSANTTDNYTGDDAFGISLDCHYEKDSFGSNGEYVK
jgi:hypothetical protein